MSTITTQSTSPATSTPGDKVKVAIIGSGNIGTDLMIKVLRLSTTLEVAAMVGIDPDSDGLARARRLGVRALSTGVDGLLGLPDFAEIQIVLDATSAQAHRANHERLRDTHVTLIDLTPAAIGPFLVPPVNLDQLAHLPNVNMVTCGGQATIPIVAAIAAVTPVHYGEIVASIASRSAGPGTRANIDEFTQTTARAIEQVGGAARAKAIIILNPAEPPLIMRDTVMCIIDECDQTAVSRNIVAMVDRVQDYVPGYRLKADVQFRRFGPTDVETDLIPDLPSADRWVVTALLEIEGAAHYLPAYAGNLDIMTSAALRTAERLVEMAAA
jgi:acetaldehyde dehydrogenase